MELEEEKDLLLLSWTGSQVRLPFWLLLGHPAARRQKLGGHAPAGSSAVARAPQCWVPGGRVGRRRVLAHPLESEDENCRSSKGPRNTPGAAFSTQWDARREEWWGGMLQFLEVGAWHTLEGDAEVLEHEFFKIPCLISSAADTLGDFSCPCLICFRCWGYAICHVFLM